jgi:hypothetical protein
MVSTGQNRRNFRIEKPRLLLVEGGDDYWFFRRLIERRRRIHDIADCDVQIVPFAQSDKLSTFLSDVIVPALVRAQSSVQAIGIVRDADDSYGSAFQSLRGALQHAGLPVPGTPAENVEGSFAGGETISVVTYVMPNNCSNGDLETLCLEAVCGAHALPCADVYLDCLKSIGLSPKFERKFRLRAFLASHQEDPTLMPGQAIMAGIIPWDSPAFADVHQFLDMLDAVS